MERADHDHFAVIGEKLAGGRMIPFVGAGANLCDRGEEAWKSGNPFLPSGNELAGYLALRGRYPMAEEHDLSRVAQYVGAARGEDELYLYLHDVFASEYAPTSLHRLLARLARRLGETGQPHLVAVTSNYDDLLERAFAEQGLEFDLVWYEAKQNAVARGRFVHRAPNGRPTVITRPNKYTGLPVTLERPAILKLHGCLDRKSASDDSYVITEDSYIDYLSGGDVGALIPIALWQRLSSSSLLFLGYSLSDWNLRVILNRMWGTRKLVGKSWAVLLEPADSKLSKIEQTLWDTRENVELVYCELCAYVRELEGTLPRDHATSQRPR
jgi:SIR2-like domain